MNVAVAGLLIFSGCQSGGGGAKSADKGDNGSNHDGWQRDFDLAKKTFSITGTNDYFVLKSGYQVQLAGGDDQVTITVMMEHQTIGGVKTRVVEERVKQRNALVRIVRHFYAYCQETGDIFNFGQDVDVLHVATPITHEGTWRAEGKKNKPGLLVPGKPKVGAKFYMSQAPDVDMDRAEITKLDLDVSIYRNCLQEVVTTPLDEQKRVLQIYAPGIGLVARGHLGLTKYGFVNAN